MLNFRNSKLLHLLVALTVLLYCLGLSTRLKPTPDSCEYLGTGQSLADGRGLEFNGFESGYYPPFMAMVISVVIRISPEQSFVILSMKIIQLILACLLAVGAGKLAERFIDKSRSRIVLLLVLGNLAVFQHCMYILSDMLFGCLTVWSLVLLEENKGVRAIAVGVVLGALAWLTRSVGLVLAGAWICYCFSRAVSDKGGRVSFLLKAVLLPPLVAMPWLVWKLYFAAPQVDYFEYWMTVTGEGSIPSIVLNRWQEMVYVVFVRVAQITMNVEFKATFFAVMIWGVLLLGFGVLVRRRASLCHWYFLCYIGLMSVWFDQGVRFFMPLLPLLLIYLLAGVEKVVEWVGRRPVLTYLCVSVPLLMAAAPIFIALADNPRGLLSPEVMIRYGAIYSVLALVGLVIGLVAGSGKMLGVIVKSFAVVYLLIFLGYAGIYGMLEHRIVGSRGPMLMGYEPYYVMGEWFGEHGEVPEPILCANESIVHYASGRLARNMGFTAAETMEKFEAGEILGVMLLRDALPGANEPMDMLLMDNWQRFEKFEVGCDSGAYRVYLYR